MRESYLFANYCIALLFVFKKCVKPKLLIKVLTERKKQLTSTCRHQSNRQHSYQSYCQHDNIFQLNHQLSSVQYDNIKIFRVFVRIEYLPYQLVGTQRLILYRTCLEDDIFPNTLYGKNYWSYSQHGMYSICFCSQLSSILLVVFYYILIIISHKKIGEVR